MTFPPPQLPPPLPRAIQSADNTRRSKKSRKRNSDPNKNTVTNAIVSVNVGLYLWMSIAGFERVSNYFVISRPLLDQGEWYRLISCGFVHFGFFHVAMNMLLAFQLGQMLEPKLGSLRFGLLYFFSLIGGSVGAVLLSPYALTGGASGAVFGLMAATVVGLRRSGVNPFKTGVGFTFVLNMVITLAVPNISIGGHFGGAAVGALYGLYLYRTTPFI